MVAFPRGSACTNDLSAFDGNKNKKRGRDKAQRIPRNTKMRYILSLWILLLQDCKLVGKKLSTTDLDLIFTKVKVRGQMRMEMQGLYIID